MDAEIRQFVDSLVGRNASDHTVKGYLGDLQQFHEYLTRTEDSEGKSKPFSVQELDARIIREYLGHLHWQQNRKIVHCSQDLGHSLLLPFSLQAPGFAPQSGQTDSVTQGAAESSQLSDRGGLCDPD